MKKIIFFIITAGSIVFTSCTKTEQVVTQTTDNITATGSFDLESYCDEGEDEDPQPALSGNVTDSIGGAFYHACVELRTTGGVLVAIIGTDISGHYFFNSVSSGSYNLIVSYPGYMPKTVPLTLTGTPRIEDVVLN